MKKQIIFIVICLCSALLLCSCEEKETTPNEKFDTQGKKLVSKLYIEFFEDDLGDYNRSTLTFEYDANGKPNKITVREEQSDDGIVKNSTTISTFAISGNILKTTNTIASTTKNYSYNLNANNYISHFEETSGFNNPNGMGTQHFFFYDNAHLLSDSSSRLDVERYTWQNGNIISILDKDDNKTTSVLYRAEENKTNIDFSTGFCGIAPDLDYDFYLGLFGFFGKLNNNYISSYSSGLENTSFQYTFDNNGYVTQIKQFENQKQEFTCTVYY